jgi:hypothetical protein
MKHWAWLLLVWLPIFAAIVLVAWIVVGALPGMKMTSDLIAWLMELPVTTCYAIAAGGATLLTLHLSGISIDPDDRDALRKAAHAGDPVPRSILRYEAQVTVGVLLIWAVFFFPHW